MIKTGVDLSHWNGNVDFAKLKKMGFDFVILKLGGSDNGQYKDPKFEENYTKAIKNGFDVGGYYFASKNFTSKTNGTKDAKHCLDLIGNKKFSMPIYIDVEVTPKTKKEGATECTIAFCEYLEKKKFYVGIYGSDTSTFSDRLELDKVKDYALWVARYGTKPKIVKSYGVWQKSSTGTVNGITGNVDLNECYTDYPTVIKKKHLNNY